MQHSNSIFVGAEPNNLEMPSLDDSELNTSQNYGTDHTFGLIGSDLQETSTLSTDFEQLYQMEHFRDVFFLIGSEHEHDQELISAHKCVLAARCPYFHNMFTLGFRESTSSADNPIKKPNVTPIGEYYLQPKF